MQLLGVLICVDKKREGGEKEIRQTCKKGVTPDWDGDVGETGEGENDGGEDAEGVCAGLAYKPELDRKVGNLDRLVSVNQIFLNGTNYVLPCGLSFPKHWFGCHKNRCKRLVGLISEVNFTL